MSNWYQRYAQRGMIPGYWIAPDGKIIPTYDHDREASKLPTRPRNRRAALAEGYIRVHVDRAGSGQCQIEGAKACNNQQTQAILTLYPTLPCHQVVVDTQMGGGRVANSPEELKQILDPHGNWRTDVPPQLMWQDTPFAAEKPTMQHGRMVRPGD